MVNIEQLPFAWTYSRNTHEGVEYWETINHALGGYRKVERRIMTGTYIIHDKAGQLCSLPASFTLDEARAAAIARKRV